MNLTKALYLIDVLKNFDLIFSIIAAFCFAGLCISVIGFFCNYSDYKKYNDEEAKVPYFLCKKVSIILSIILCISSLFVAFIPSEKTMYAMLITDNYTEIKGEVRDNIDYIFDKVDELMRKNKKNEE